MDSLRRYFWIGNRYTQHIIDPMTLSSKEYLERIEEPFLLFVSESSLIQTFEGMHAFLFT